MAPPSTALQKRAPQQPQPKPKVSIWQWEATARNGDKRTGEMEGVDALAVESRLLTMGLTPVKIRKKASSLSLPMLGGVSQKDLLVFTRMFATMIDAGLPLVQCLELLANQQTNAEMKRVLTAVKNKVEGGATFAESLRDHPKVFDTLYSSLVDAGEVAGILDTILNRLAAYIEKNSKLKKKVKGALTYPIIVLVVAIGIVAGMLLFIIPIFEKMFSDMGGDLPKATKVVVAMSEWMQSYWPHCAGVLAAIMTFIYIILTNKKTRKIFDTSVLTLPLAGDLICKIAVARFTRTLGTMVSSGVPILDGLSLVARTAGNMRIEEAIYYVSDKISEGKTIAEPLGETKIFPDLVVQMIAVGESTGALDQMLNKIADFYDDEVDAAVDMLTSMIEPVLMVGMGGICGGMLISMYLPIFSLAGAIN